MKKTTLYIIQGFIGSGKTTFSKKMAVETGAVHLNTDELVIKLFDKKDLESDWEKCFDETCNILLQKTKEFLNSGKSVILDMGFWHRPDRDYAKSMARECNSDFKHYYLYVPDNILKERIVSDRPFEWAEKHLKNFDKNKKMFTPPEADEEAITINNF
ncbi:MAG: ATP-binding protein [Christensenellaceae bacterium]|nr:ATP-binding protein [Christensenellaceae bacterium]